MPATFIRLASRAVALPARDIDTDQIVPARFLKTVGRDGLGAALFADWRDRPGFPLSAPEAAGARILLAGGNFGCGSSREHAAWALLAWGLRAVVAPSFADIFRGNALRNGLVPVAVPEPFHEALLARHARDPSLRLEVDLEAGRLALPDGTFQPFAVDAFSRHCLLNGTDELGYLLSLEERIAAHESRDPDR